PHASMSCELDIDGIRLRVLQRSNQRLDIALIIETGPIDPVTNSRPCTTISSILEVGYVFRRIKLGERPYFICPLTGKDCLNLFIYGNLCGSEEGIRRLKGGVGTPSP